MKLEPSWKTSALGEKSILNPDRKWVASGKTDLRKTFRRIEREQKEQAERDKQNEFSRIGKVRQINRG